MALAPERPKIYEGSRIPQHVPTILRVPDELRDSEDVLEINFGPNHPSTHGVLRLVIELHGEHVVGLRAVIGYLHTGFEKNMEHKTWWKAITYSPRTWSAAVWAEAETSGRATTWQMPSRSRRSMKITPPRSRRVAAQPISVTVCPTCSGRRRPA